MALRSVADLTGWLVSLTELEDTVQTDRGWKISSEAVLGVNRPQEERGTGAWDSPRKGAEEVPWERTPVYQGQEKGDSAPRGKTAPAGGHGLQD